MTHPTRWAMYRDRSPLAGPVYLGDVLAAERDAAARDGATQYGAPVVAQCTTSRAPRAAGQNTHARIAR